MTHKLRPRPNSLHFMTEEREGIQALAREFAHDVVLPLANELDPVEGRFPDWFIKQMADMGFFGILIPEEYGGLGVFEYCLVAEELSRAWMSVGGLLARGNGMGGNFSSEQEARLLSKVATGEYLGVYSLAEAEAGSDVANIRCKATRAADGGWVINGTKMWCTFADQADYIILFARTSTDENKRHRGISAFLVEKERGSFPEGMSGTAVKEIGYFGWKTWDLNFDDFHLPAEALLGEEDKGFYQAALEDLIAYLKQREQFGHFLPEFQLRTISDEMLGR